MTILLKKPVMFLRNVTGSVSVQSLKKANCLFFIPDRSGILFFPIFFREKRYSGWRENGLKNAYCLDSKKNAICS